MKAITIEDNEAYLRQISTPVSLNDKNLNSYINVLEDYCTSQQVMAMASIQLGIPKRVIYLKNTNIDIINRMQFNTKDGVNEKYNEAKVLLNPIILKKEGLTTYWEACASCMDNMGCVKRPYRILLEYYDIKGKKHEELFEGFESTVLSHEMDHLDGVLHIDIADEIIVLSREDRKKFRQTHGYTIFYKDGDFEELRIRTNLKR